MKKRISLFAILALLAALLAGCAGTPVVYYADCQCPGGVHALPSETAADKAEPAEGALKTGLAISVSPAKSKNAASVEYDVTLAAVLVDDQGIIRACRIDSLPASVKIDGTGAVLSELTGEIPTKNERGYDYGMKNASSRYEWFEQAAFVAEFAVGKTVQALKTGAISEAGYAKEGTDLATKATIHIGSYVDAIEKAAQNASHKGAQAGDVLYLPSVNSLSSSKSASAESAGLAQLDLTACAVTARDGKITSCVIDSLQAKVEFDASGTLLTDLNAPFKTKNELGSAYNMKTWGKAIAEWDQQAAAFGAYVTGKTPQEVLGIHVTESGKPADADLTSSVTISIGDFQALIEKAFR